MRILLIILLASFSLSAQSLKVDDTFNAERLVREVFASGQCETISNIKRIGDNETSIAFFEGGLEGVGFDKGIILSTGEAKLAPGPNSDTDVGTSFDPTLTADQDLFLASTGTTFDRSGIEFDFVPLSPLVTFRYVFASEEYCEFVGEDFNDIFGFFISGPGINGPFSDGAVNIATVPNSNDPVSINNINFRVNSQYYLDNEFPSVRSVAGCGGSNLAGPRFNFIEYDGLTVILTATVELKVCETYHLRLVIGDVADNKLDSAVFLEAGSFNLGGSVSLGNEGGGKEPPIIFEGCTPGNIRVERGADSDIRFPQTIGYRIGANSVASAGADFDAGPGSVTIPAGESHAFIPISGLNDEVTEGPELAWLFLDIPCACYSDSISFIITEPEELEIGLSEAFYCPNEGTQLNAMVTGGVEPYRYQWSFGSADSMPLVPAPLPATFDVTVTDACGRSVTNEVKSFETPPPNLRVELQDLRACRGQTLSAEVFLTGNGPFILEYTVNNGRLQSFEFAGDSLQNWPLDQSGDYNLVGIRDQACYAALDTTVRVDFFVPFVTPQLTEPSCAGGNDGIIDITHLPTVAPYTYDFFGLDSTGLFYDDVTAGNYGVRVTDALGCTDFRSFSLRDPDPIIIPIIDCIDIRRPPLQPSALGGQAPYEYSIDGQRYFGEELFRRLEEGATYNLRVRDAEGCVVSAPQFFWPKATPRMANLPTFVPQELAGSAPVDVNYLVPASQLVFYQWLPQEIFSCPTCPETEVMAPNSQSISLVLEDIYGCRDSLVTQVAIDGRVPVYVPNIFSPNGDGTNDKVAVFANSAQVTEVVSFRVFNRWGGMVWEDFEYPPNNADRGWDGVINGQLAGDGAYTWTATVRLTTGDLQAQSGSVVLLNGGR